MFQKDGLLENATIFESTPDGRGTLPEALLEDPNNEKTPIVVANFTRKPAGNFQKGKPYQKGQRGPTTYEDDQDERDPEWLDQSEKVDDEDVYFGRVIQD